MITENIKGWISKNVHFLTGVEVPNEIITSVPADEMKRRVDDTLLDKIDTAIKRKMRKTEFLHPFKIKTRYEAEVYIFSQEDLKTLLDLHEAEVIEKTYTGKHLTRKENKELTLIDSVNEIEMLAIGFMINNDDEPIVRFIKFKEWCSENIRLISISYEEFSEVCYKKVYAPQLYEKQGE